MTSNRYLTLNEETYYSQAWQDQFVDLMLMDSDGNLCQDGFFVDVGAGTDQDSWGSNSFVFEQRGWSGIAIDSDINRLVERNCLIDCSWIGTGKYNTVTLSEVLRNHNAPKVLDYLSIDLDTLLTPDGLLEGMDLVAIQTAIEAGYTFKILTIEHDLYRRGQSYKDEIFFYLASKGYVRIVDNVGDKANIDDLYKGFIFEDWYIDPREIDYQTCLFRLKNRWKIWQDRLKK